MRSSLEEEVKEGSEVLDSPRRLCEGRRTLVRGNEGEGDRDRVRAGRGRETRIRRQGWSRRSRKNCRPGLARRLQSEDRKQRQRRRADDRRISELTIPEEGEARAIGEEDQPKVRVDNDIGRVAQLMRWSDLATVGECHLSSRRQAGQSGDNGCSGFVDLVDDNHSTVLYGKGVISERRALTEAKTNSLGLHEEEANGHNGSHLRQATSETSNSAKQLSASGKKETTRSEQPPPASSSRGGAG